MNRVQSDSYWYDTGYKTARKETADKMLEIIDNEDDYFDQLIRRGEVADLYEIFERMRDAVLALKGSEQE